MAPRTDVHRPKEFDPSDYRAVGYVDCGKAGKPSWDWVLRDLDGLSWEERRRYWDETPAADRRSEITLKDIQLVPQFAREKAEQFWPGGHVPNTNTGRIDRCAHCGAAIVRIVVVEHVPTGDLLPFGVVCAERAEMPGLDALAIHHNANDRKKLQVELLFLSLTRRFDQQAASLDYHFPGLLAPDSDPVRMVRAVATLLSKDGMTAAELALNIDPADKSWGDWEQLAARRYRQDGWLKFGGVRTLLEGEVKRSARIAKNAALAQAPPILPGEQTVVGEIKAAKWKSYNIPGKGVVRTIKCTVENVAGNRFWVSAPKSLRMMTHDDPAKMVGRTISFVGTVKPADGDPHFGFVKSPRNAVIT